MALWLLSFLVLFLLLAWRPSNPRTALICSGAALLTFSLGGPDAFAMNALLWLIYLGALSAWLLPTVRRDYLVLPAMHWLRDQLLPYLPGTRAQPQGWVNSLLHGRPDWHRLRPLQLPALNPEEQAFLDGPVTRLCGQLTRGGSDEEHWAAACSHGLPGLAISAAQGGLGHGATAQAATLARLSSLPAGLRLARAIAGISPSVANLLQQHGSPEQQALLPELADASIVICSAEQSCSAQLTEGDHADETTLGLSLQAELPAIALATLAHKLLLPLQFDDPDGLLGQPGKHYRSIALLPLDLPGTDIQPDQGAFAAGQIRLADVFIPLHAIIGGRTALDRPLDCPGEARGLPAICSGALQSLARQSGASLRLHQAWSGQGHIETAQQHALAELAAQTYAGRAMARFAAAAQDWGEAGRDDPGQTLAQFGSSLALRDGLLAATRLQQVLHLDSNDSQVNALWPMLPALLAQGSRQERLPARLLTGSAALSAHPYWPALLQALEEQNSDRAAPLLGAQLGRLINLGVRSWIHGLSGARLAAAPDLPYRRHYQQLSRYAGALALLNEIRILRAGTNDDSTMSAALGTALAQLYRISACLKQYDEQGCLPDEHQLLDWLGEHAWQEIETALLEAIATLPSRSWRGLCRLLLLPLGRRTPASLNACRQRLAEQLLDSGSSRPRLSAEAYTPTSDDGWAGTLELALQGLSRHDGLWQRMQRAREDGQLDGNGDWLDQARAHSIVSAEESRFLDRFSAMQAALFGPVQPKKS